MELIGLVTGCSPTTGPPTNKPDVACDQWLLFVWIPEEALAGRWYAADIDTKQAVTSKLQTLDTTFFYGGIEHALIPRWDKSLNVSGDCVEVLWVSSATYGSCIQVAAYRVGYPPLGHCRCLNVRTSL